MQTSTAQTGLCHGEGVALTTEQIVDGYAHGVVAHIGMAAMALGFAANADIAHDLETRRAGGHEEHRHALVHRHLGISDGHDDHEGRETQ